MHFLIFRKNRTLSKSSCTCGYLAMSWRTLCIFGETLVNSSSVIPQQISRSCRNTFFTRSLWRAGSTNSALVSSIFNSDIHWRISEWRRMGKINCVVPLDDVKSMVDARSGTAEIYGTLHEVGNWEKTVKFKTKPLNSPETVRPLSVPAKFASQPNSCAQQLFSAVNSIHFWQQQPSQLEGMPYRIGFRSFNYKQITIVVRANHIPPLCQTFTASSRN